MLPRPAARATARAAPHPWRGPLLPPQLSENQGSPRPSLTALLHVHTRSPPPAAPVDPAMHPVRVGPGSGLGCCVWTRPRRLASNSVTWPVPGFSWMGVSLRTQRSPHLASVCGVGRTCSRCGAQGAVASSAGRSPESGCHPLTRTGPRGHGRRWPALPAGHLAPRQGSGLLWRGCFSARLRRCPS